MEFMEDEKKWLASVLRDVFNDGADVADEDFPKYDSILWKLET